MTFPQLIHDVKTKGYYAAISSKEIRAQYDRLLQIRESDLIGVNLYEWRAVKALLELKLSLTELIEQGMAPEPYAAFIRTAELSKGNYRSARIAEDAGFTGSDERFVALQTAVERLRITFREIDLDFDRLMVDGAYRGTLKDFTLLSEKYGAMKVEGIGELFPELDKGTFRFVSIKKTLFALLKAKLDELMKAMFAGFGLTEDFSADTVSQYDALSSVPNLSLAQGIKDAPVLFVCTPIREEFDIMLNANLHANGIERVLQIDLAKLPKKTIGHSRDSLARFLLYVKKERDPNVIAFYGREALSEQDEKNLYAAIADYLSLVAEDVRLVFWDPSGDMQGLSSYSRVKAELPLVPAENRYLRLPSYADACELVPTMDDKKKEILRERCVFMGYLGLNYFYAKEEEQGLALDTAKRISEQNAMKVLSFLSRLPDNSKLVPLDWGYDPAIEKSVRPDGGEYNYDEIRDVSDERIRAIIANNSLTIYEKCGELVRYVLLADEDKSVWKEVLSDEEKESRIARATRIVAYTMRVYYSNPKVTVVHSNAPWGGLCCNGGQEIKFKKSDTENVNWLMDAILHELYHSLQHTLTDTMVDPSWYKKTYHISNERIASWNDNNGVYLTLGEGQDALYMVQSIEVDARDFAGLCLGDQVFHDHDKRSSKRG